MTEDPRKRRGDWAVNSELLTEEIEAIWAVRVHMASTHHTIGGKRNLLIVEAVAVLTPPVPGFPQSIRTLVPVDRQYVTPYDRAEYMSLYQLYIALDALDAPLRRRPQ